MAWSTSGVTDIFAGASMTGGALTIPSGTITSYIPITNTNPGASELVFGLCETMHSKSEAGGQHFSKPILM